MKSTMQSMQKVSLVIDFIIRVLDKKLDREMELNAEEKRAFESFLLSLKDFLRQTHECTIEVLKPDPEELVRNKELMYQYMIDGIIAGYKLGSQKINYSQTIRLPLPQTDDVPFHQ